MAGPGTAPAPRKSGANAVEKQVTVSIPEGTTRLLGFVKSRSRTNIEFWHRRKQSPKWSVTDVAIARLISLTETKGKQSEIVFKSSEPLVVRTGIVTDNGDGTVTIEGTDRTGNPQTTTVSQILSHITTPRNVDVEPPTGMAPPKTKESTTPRRPPKPTAAPARTPVRQRA